MVGGPSDEKRALDAARAGLRPSMLGERTFRAQCVYERNNQTLEYGRRVMTELFVCRLQLGFSMCQLAKPPKADALLLM
jgi:hypothetical protein